MTDDDILNKLVAMSSGQFDVFVGKIGCPVAYLSGPNAPLATRATELYHWLRSEKDRRSRAEKLLTIGEPTPPSVASFPIGPKIRDDEIGEPPQAPLCPTPTTSAPAPMIPTPSISPPRYDGRAQPRAATIAVIAAAPAVAVLFFKMFAGNQLVDEPDDASDAATARPLQVEVMTTASPPVPSSTASTDPPPENNRTTDIQKVNTQRLVSATGQAPAPAPKTISSADPSSPSMPCQLEMVQWKDASEMKPYIAKIHHERWPEYAKRLEAVCSIAHTPGPHPAPHGAITSVRCKCP